MQRSWVTPKDRAGAIAGVLLIHAGVLAALLALGPNLGGSEQKASPTTIFDVPAPQPPPPEPVAVDAAAAPRKEGASAPPAKKAEASPVVRPEPRGELAAEPVLSASSDPGEGSASSQGAAPVPGPGTGAGGQGNGSGSGSAGAGTGGGGSGGEAQRPALASRALTQRDYSGASRRAWPSGRRVLVSFDVQLNGRATGCRIVQSSGVASIDAETCRLVTTKLRFRPARDRDGRPVVERYGYLQYPLF